MNEINFDKEFERAVQAGAEANATEARATAVRFDPERKEILISLKFGGTFAFRTEFVPVLQGRSDDELADVELSPSGGGLHWERIDVDLSLPSLIEGNFGPEKSGLISLDQLYAELESVWNDTRDAAVVDRLALGHPQYTSELYDYFALLIESELSSDQAEVADSSQRTREWLDAEGFKMVKEISSRNDSDLSPTPPPTDDDQNLGTSHSPGAVGPGTDVEARKVLPFTALARSVTGRGADELAEEMDLPENLISIVQRAPPGRQQSIRREIARRATAFGIDADEAFASLEVPLRLAARKRSGGPEPSFREQISHLRAPKEKLEYWLNLADKEDQK